MSLKVCSLCGGLYTTEPGESFGGNPCRCVFSRTTEDAEASGDQHFWIARIKQVERENADLKAKLAQAVIEANRRDQKWMDGINEILGEKLNYTDPGGHNHASMALDKWARDIKAKLAQVEADAASMREALVFAARLDYLQEHNGIANRVRAALATGSGQALLDELAALRKQLESSFKGVLSIRCIHHIAVPQQNKNEHSGGECGACIAAERDTLRATAERRLELLRKCMWIPAKAGPWCPGCERLQEFGHKPDCQLAAELAGKEGA